MNRNSEEREIIQFNQEIDFFQSPKIIETQKTQIFEKFSDKNDVLNIKSDIFFKNKCIKLNSFHKNDSHSSKYKHITFAFIGFILFLSFFLIFRLSTTKLGLVTGKSED